MAIPRYWCPTCRAYDYDYRPPGPCPKCKSAAHTSGRPRILTRRPAYRYRNTT